MTEPDGPQMTIWCMFDVCWITNAAITHSEYVILIAFPLQPWLQECNSVLHYIVHILVVVNVTEYYCRGKSRNDTYKELHSRNMINK
jgi:hypothetical protein